MAQGLQRSSKYLLFTLTRVESSTWSSFSFVETLNKPQLLSKLGIPQPDGTQHLLWQRLLVISLKQKCQSMIKVLAFPIQIRQWESTHRCKHHNCQGWRHNMNKTLPTITNTNHTGRNGTRACINHDLKISVSVEVRLLDFIPHNCRRASHSLADHEVAKIEMHFRNKR